MPSDHLHLVRGLRAAADPSRLRLLGLLALGEFAVSELTDILGQSQPRVSRHLRVLTEAGLLERFRELHWVFYRLAAEGEGAALARALLVHLDRRDPVVSLDRERAAEVLARRAAGAGGAAMGTGRPSPSAANSPRWSSGSSAIAASMHSCTSATRRRRCCRCWDRRPVASWASAIRASRCSAPGPRCTVADCALRLQQGDLHAMTAGSRISTPSCSTACSAMVRAPGFARRRRARAASGRASRGDRGLRGAGGAERRRQSARRAAQLACRERPALRAHQAGGHGDIAPAGGRWGVRAGPGGGVNRRYDEAERHGCEHER